MQKIIIAHRGASGHEKENTLEAFQKAIELGADMVEFDVRKTGDGKLILFHDPKVNGKKISKISFEELFKIAEKQGFRVPTLEETLQFLRGKIKLDVEIKERGYEKEVVDLILRYFSKDNFFITSFNESTVLLVKKDFPEIKTGLILGKEWENIHHAIRTRLGEIFPFFRIRRLGIDFVIPHYLLAKIPFYINIIGRLGFPVIVWTVNGKKMGKRLMEKENVVGIITDYPDLYR
jgi:glycerophosphoryl diester phosphodiesterase